MVAVTKYEPGEEGYPIVVRCTRDGQGGKTPTIRKFVLARNRRGLPGTRDELRWHEKVTDPRNRTTGQQTLFRDGSATLPTPLKGLKPLSIGRGEVVDRARYVLVCDLCRLNVPVADMSRLARVLDELMGDGLHEISLLRLADLLVSLPDVS